MTHEGAATVLDRSRGDAVRASGTCMPFRLRTFSPAGKRGPAKTCRPQPTGRRLSVHPVVCPLRKGPSPWTTDRTGTPHARHMSFPRQFHHGLRRGTGDLDAPREALSAAPFQPPARVLSPARCRPQPAHGGQGVRPVRTLRVPGVLSPIAPSGTAFPHVRAAHMTDGALRRGAPPRCLPLLRKTPRPGMTGPFALAGCGKDRAGQRQTRTGQGPDSDGTGAGQRAPETSRAGPHGTGTDDITSATAGAPCASDAAPAWSGAALPAARRPESATASGAVRGRTAGGARRN